MSRSAFSIWLWLVMSTITSNSHAQTPAEPLIWDALTKEYSAKPGETNIHLFFKVRNASTNEISINEVSTSCTCSLATLPSTPWLIKPGAEGQIDIAVDLRGKSGTLTKVAVVHSSIGPKILSFKVNIPEKSSRERNLEMAKVDRQAVFKQNCAECHSKPTTGKSGRELYEKACGICHESEHRATMVPDLHQPKHPTDRDYWKQWVMNGKAGTLMPAFSNKEGGPLNDEQVKSLVDFLAKQFPTTTKGAAVSK